MKLKTLVIGGSGLFLMVFSLLLFVAILFSDEQDSGISNIHYGGVNVSAEVLAHKPMVEKYAKEYGVEEYVNILLAIIQVESGGTAEDVMQSSESLGLPPNSLSTEESIKQGVKYFSELLASSERLSVDLESVIQSYNYGGGFLGLVLCQEKVQIKYNQFSLCLAKLNLLFLSHFLLDFSDILPHIGLGINTRNGCEYVLYCKMFLCIQKSTYMHVYN